MSNSAHHPWLNSYPRDILWNVTITPRPLPTILDEAENTYPSRPAIDFMGRVTTYRELASQVRRMANGLARIGVRKGVKVGLFLPNCPQFVISYFAILKAGGTVVNYNPLYTEREIHHQIEDSATELMVTLSLRTLYPKVAEQLGKSRLQHIIVSGLEEALPFSKRLGFRFLKKKEIAEVPRDAQHTRFADLLGSPDADPGVVVHPEDDVAVYQYTGGTTGVPKAAMLTHANLHANTVQCGMWFSGMEYGRERLMGALPLFHVFAMTTVMNVGIHTGSQIILHPRFDMQGVLKDVDQKKITLMPGVPTMFAAINNSRHAGQYDLTSLKICISGGAPLPLEVKERFEKRTGCKLIEGYGLSETSPVATANPLFGLNKAGSIGLPLPGTVIEITDLDDPDRLLPIGEKGEVCVRGPQVMRGYLHNLDETSRALRGGRLHTGDIGMIDSQGYVTIVDRLKEMIISGGYNIYPRNIEEALYTHPDILEAAVVGIPHEQRGPVPKAFVVKREGSGLDGVGVKEFLRERIAAYAVPPLVEFRAHLPKSMIGKILKKELLAEELAKKKIPA